MGLVEGEIALPVTAEGEFTVFYRHEFDDIYRAALAFSRDRETALDATQEAFARAFARWSRLRREPWAGGWVMTTALNSCRRLMRKRNVPAFVESAGAVPGPGPERLDLVAALAALAPRRRQAAVLYFVGDFPVGVVAQLMDLSEGAVRAHVSLARAELQKRLG